MKFDPQKELFAGLPIYPDGHVNPAPVSGGQGLHDGRQLENPEDMGPFYDGETVTDDQIRDRLLTLTECHRFYNEEGYVCLRYLYNDRVVFVKIKDGIVHAKFQDDFVSEPEQHEYVRVVTGTGLIPFMNYMNTLTSCGCEKLYERKLENNYFFEFRYGADLLYCIFNGNIREARFLLDPASEPIATFGNDAKGTCSGEVYQLMTSYRRMVTGYSCDCGMCYVIKLPDSSVFIIDGFEAEQITRRVTEYTMDLLHKISGTAPGEKIPVAGWFSTHAHDDHMDFFAHLIEVYHDELDLQRVMFNFPDTHQIYVLPQVYTTINRIRKYYPNVRYRKLHAGDKFNLGGAEFDILYSHELGIGETGYEPKQNTNDTTTLMKISLGGMTFFCLGDMDTTTETKVMKILGETALHADVVTASHHLINLLEYFYDAVHADYCLVPKGSRCRMPGVVDHEYLQIARTVPYDNFFFAGDGTDGLRYENGKVVHFYHDPLIGVFYDGTEL